MDVSIYCVLPPASSGLAFLTRRRGAVFARADCGWACIGTFCVTLAAPGSDSLSLTELSGPVGAHLLSVCVAGSGDSSVVAAAAASLNAAFGVPLQFLPPGLVVPELVAERVLLVRVVLARSAADPWPGIAAGDASGFDELLSCHPVTAPYAPSIAPPHPATKLRVRRVVCVGADCAAASAARFAGLRGRSLPFDWVRSTPSAILRFHRIGSGGDAVFLFADDNVVPVAHTPNTVEYHRLAAAESSGETKLLFDTRFSLIATETEAANAARRACRWHDVVAPAADSADSPPLMLLFVGRVDPGAASLFPRVDGAPLAPIADGADEAVVAIRDLIALAKDVAAASNDRSIIVLAFNVVPFPFQVACGSVHMLHVFAGYGNSGGLGETDAAWVTVSKIVSDVLSAAVELA